MDRLVEDERVWEISSLLAAATAPTALRFVVEYLSRRHRTHDVAASRIDGIAPFGRGDGHAICAPDHA